MALPPVTPYAFGYVMTRDQLRQLALHFCAEADVDKSQPHLERLLNDHCAAQKLPYCFAPYILADDTRNAIWVTGALPSFDGKMPKARMPPVDLRRYPWMKDVGAVEPKCFPWPRGIAQPDWFTNLLIRVTARLIDWGYKA